MRIIHQASKRFLKKIKFGCLFQRQNKKKYKLTAWNLENSHNEVGPEVGLGILVCEGQLELCN